MLVFLFTVIVLILTYIVSTVIKPKNYPPGPKWYPFFGCFGLVMSRMGKYGSQWKALSEMGKEFSTNVLGLKLGGQLVVVVYGEKNIRQATTAKEYDARPYSFVLRPKISGQRVDTVSRSVARFKRYNIALGTLMVRSCGNKLELSITFTDGNLWREHRSFAIKHLRMGGFGKQSMERDIHEQLSNLLSILDKSYGNSISIRTPIAMALMNIAWKYVAGEHIKENRLRQLLYYTSARSKEFTLAGGYLDQWPWLRFIFPNWTGYNIMKKTNEMVLDIIQDSINRHKNNTVAGNDYIHSFLKEMSDGKDTYSEKQLLGVCLDFLIAASNTGSSALDFAFIHLMRHPDVQEKLYDEISQTLGDSTPSWADNERLIYTSAFLSEVHRCCTIAPFLGGRRAVADFEMDGYTIPKGTTVLVSIGDLHGNPNCWDEPDKFKPERFIDGNGALRTPANFYPFGLGRRRCPGEPLAKAFVFIILVGILQKYKITCDGDPPSAEPVIGLLAEPMQFTAQFVKRP